MIQDISPSRMYNQYQDEKHPDEKSIILCMEGSSILVRTGDEPCFPLFCQLTLAKEPIFLFQIDEIPFFLSLEKPEQAPEGFDYIPVRQLRREKIWDLRMVFAAFTADHLAGWYRANRFCGACGAPTVLGKGERRLDCTKCKNQIYPRINPAVIVGVRSKDHLLITHYARSRGVTVPALVAGFTEIGETFEDTVRREVLEEVGLKVTNVRYYKSQPWGIAADLLAGFYCDVVESEDITLDQQELADATWVKREDITGQPDNLSLTNEMMLRFRDGLDKVEPER